MNQTNPMGTENPCPLLKPKGTVKTRGITAYDLLKAKPTLKVERSQKEIQTASRPQFDHPKILHILIDRANGFGCKTLAKRHGGTHGTISTFCKSMGFDMIERSEQLLSNGEKHGRSAQEIYEEEWMKEVQSTKKDRTWSYHPAYVAWYSMKKYYADNPVRPVFFSKDEADRRNKESRRRSSKRQRKKPINKIKHNLRKRLRDYIKSSGSVWRGFGCSSDELRDHIEKQFKQGMTWENYGTYWHIDHIRPCASFDLMKEEDKQLVNHYTNLQPMEASENIAKSDQWDGQTSFIHAL